MKTTISRVLLLSSGVVLSCNIFAAPPFNIYKPFVTFNKLKAETKARTNADLELLNLINQIALTPGPQGLIGLTGAPGPQGPVGPTGAPGRDLTKLQNEITVSASGGDFTNPIDAVNSILDASSTNPYVVRIGPGVYELGANRLNMKPFVNIVGAGQEVTIITGIGSGNGIEGDQFQGVIQGASDAALIDLTVQNSGGNGSTSYAIYNASASPRIERVTASAWGGRSTNCAVSNHNSSSPIMNQVIASASGGSSNSGNSGVCNSNNSAPIMTQVTASASGGSSNSGATIPRRS